MGGGRYLVFYLLGGVVASLAQIATAPTSTALNLGASGAIAAVMGVYFVLYPRSQVLTAIFLVLYLDVIEVPAVIFLGVWLIMQLLAGLASMGAGAADGGMAIGAHLTGFAIGLTTGALLRQREKRREWEE